MDFCGIEIVESPFVPKGWIVLRNGTEVIAAAPAEDGKGYRIMTFRAPPLSKLVPWP